MKEYIPRKPKEYRLPNNIYMRVLYTVRCYPDTVRRLNDILENSSPAFTEYIDKRDGKIKRAIMPRAKGLNMSVEQKAMQRIGLLEEIEAIDNALKKIPIEYRQYVFDNVVYKTSYPDIADKSTWSRWRTRFLYYVAENLNIL